MQLTRRDFFRLTLSGIASCLVCACSPDAPKTAAGTLVARFLKVGKADAILLSTNTANVMVDTGTAASSFDVVDRLEELGIDSLDTLIITHFDQDHIGGAAAVLDAVKVGEVLTSYQAKESEEVDAYKEALARHGLTARVVSADETLKRADMTIDVLAPRKTAYDQDTSNNSSLVCRVTFGDTRMLLAGDIQAERIAELLDAKTDLACDLLKVPHHGAYEKKGHIEEFISAASPRYAVICCSKKQSEDKKVVEALEDVGAEYYLTRKGEVTATSDGKTLSVEQ